jgi:hypothetical protein
MATVRGARDVEGGIIGVLGIKNYDANLGRKF